jgi:hypothetical protein
MWKQGNGGHLALLLALVGMWLTMYIIVEAGTMLK